MKSLRFLDRQTGYSLTAVATLLAMLVPGLVPAFASAAQVTTRSVTLSSATANASGVTYEVKFTAVGAAAGFVLDFCNDSPVPGQTCTKPTGFSTAGVGTSTGSTTVAAANTNRSVVVTKAITGSENVDVVLTGIHNPTDATTAEANEGFYARIITYSDMTSDTPGDGGADEYTATDLKALAVDNGGVAMAITDNIGVTAAVRESMTFCVSGTVIDQDCGANGGDPLTAPTLVLGEAVGGTARALTPTALSTGSVYTQLSTNAATGAVVNLKSGTDCGGLKRVGASTCDIIPAAGDFTFGAAKFGVKTATSSGTSGYADASGTLIPYTASGYNDSGYNLNFDDGDTTGVTSTYGDPFIFSNNLPVNNQNMQLTFGASVSNNTPAGTYSTSLNLIATGKY